MILNINLQDSGIKRMDFVFGNSTEAYFACSIIFNGKTLILGGKQNYNQVNKETLCT